MITNNNSKNNNNDDDNNNNNNNNNKNNNNINTVHYYHPNLNTPLLPPPPYYIPTIPPPHYIPTITPPQLIYISSIDDNYNIGCNIENKSLIDQIDKNEIFDSTLFYSVFLSIIVFIVYIFNNVAFQNLAFSSSYWGKNTNYILNIFYTISCFISPIVISRFNIKKSMVAGIIFVFLSIFIAQCSGIVFEYIAYTLDALGTELVNLGVYTLMVLVTINQKYNYLLFGMFLTIKYGFEAAVFRLGVGQFFNPKVYVPLLFIVLILSIILPSRKSSPSSSSSSSTTITNILNVIPQPKLLFKDTKFILVLPIVLFFGVFVNGYLPLSSYVAALTVLPVSLLLQFNLISKIKIFGLLVISCIVSMVFSYLRARSLDFYINYVYYGFTFSSYSVFYYYSPSFIPFSIFFGGTMVLLLSSLSNQYSNQIELILPVVSSLRLFNSIGILLNLAVGSLFRNRFSYELSWYILVIPSFIISIITFYKYLNSVQN